MNIKQLTILTGPQASGKSTIAKAIYYFLSLNELFQNYIVSDRKNLEVSLDNLKKFMHIKFETTFDVDFITLSEMSIKYNYSEKTWIKVFVNENQKLPNRVFIDFDFSDNFKQIINKYKNFDTSYWKDNQNEKNMQKEFNEFFDIDYIPIYIPAGRSAVVSMVDYLNKLFLSGDVFENYTVERNIGSGIKDYAIMILEMRKHFSKGMDGLFNDVLRLNPYINEGLINETMELIEEIVKGKYFYRNGEEFLTVGDNVNIKVNFASSGQQEILWVCNVIFFYLLTERRVFLILEEPEAHLYPDSQKYISELIGLFLHADNFAIITTHSPYILGEFNNLLYANEIKDFWEEREGILTSTRLLPYDDTQAFYISNGEKFDGMENHLIRNELIDGASISINEENDKLMELKWRQVSNE